MSKKIASKILALERLWQETDSSVISGIIETEMLSRGYMTPGARLNKLMEITDSKRHAVYAWLNRGRENVKIPFLKLCMIADKLNIDIEKVITGGNNMYQQKFIVKRVVGNVDEVIKFFDVEEKDKAVAYAKEISEKNVNGIIVCAKGMYDENGKSRNNEEEIFEII
jgi:hypothetical protein